MGIIFNQKRFIFSLFFNELIKSDPIILADAGAKDGLHQPWLNLDKAGSLYVIGFEPDKDECDKLNATKKPNRIYIPAALWSSEGKVDIHLAQIRSTSSVYAPNFEFIKQYKDCHWKPRITKSVITVDSVILDKVLKDKKIDCDFLKIDTQGAEFEIIQGATRSIADNIFGVLIETWTSEVHSGQHLTGDILTSMTKLGFSLFDISIAAAWQRKIDKNIKLFGKKQVIGLDLLFFKDTNKFVEGGKKLNKIIKAAAISDVYGFPDYALEILNSANNMDDGIETLKNIKDNIIGNSLKQNRFYRKSMRVLFKILGVKNYDFPSLHY